MSNEAVLWQLEMPDLHLWEIELNDFFWVVVQDGHDPIETLLRHCPDHLEPDDFPGYWDQDEWPDDWGPDEQIDHLAKRIKPRRVTDEVELDAVCVEHLRLNPAEWVEDWDDETDWCSAIWVPVDRLVAVSEHGDMWSERWSE